MKQKREISDSFAIDRVEYDTESRVLTLHVLNRGRPQTLTYGDVPVSVYKTLLDSPSKGGYFNRSIRNTFPHISTINS